MVDGQTRILLATEGEGPCKACLLYTSDAADERSSVDLGGRRIIKKKNNEKQSARGGVVTLGAATER